MAAGAVGAGTHTSPVRLAWWRLLRIVVTLTGNAPGVWEMFVPSSIGMTQPGTEGSKHALVGP